MESPSLLFVQSDQFCIEAILTNLIDNALYYSPKDSLVNIKVQSMNDQTILSISNQLSEEMDDEDLNCMFEPLWQKDKSRTSEQHFGLGLSIVKRLCSQMDIELSVHLQPENIIKFRLVFGNTQL